MTFMNLELPFVNKVPAIRYTKSSFRNQNNQFLRPYWQQVSCLSFQLLEGFSSTRTCCFNAQLPLWSQSCRHQSCTRPVFILPTMVHDCYVNVVEEVESVLLVKLWLQNISETLRNFSNRRGRKHSRTLKWDYCPRKEQERRGNTSTFTSFSIPLKMSFSVYYI